LNPKRIVATCLLVVYGLPAIAGPYWQHHGQSCANSCVERECSESTTALAASTQVPHRFGACGGNCCTQRQSSSNSKNQQPCKHEERDEEDHQGCCVVCGFYAQAYFASAPVELPKLTVWLPLFADPIETDCSCQTIPSLARGPPAVC
jgi:hypothetical protein